jgi:SAM-dependent methyltransferase
MAENIGTAENNERFREYPYNIRETWWNDMQREKMRQMASRIREGEWVADVGCNAGYLPEFLPVGCVAHGIDLSPALVERARERGLYRSVAVAPAEEQPFDDKSMDVVVMAGVIEYPFDPQQVLRECARVARRIVIVEACHEDGIWGAERIPIHSHMVRSYNEETLVKEVATIGRVTWIHVVNGDGVGLHGQPQHRIVEVTL